VAARTNARNGEGFSFDTLLIASIASATAAIVTSQFWQGGTPIAAAVTPIIVSLVSEALKRPMQSELVRRRARRAAELSAAPIRRYRTGEPPVVTEDREREVEPAPPDRNGEADTPQEYTVYGARREEPPAWRERLSGWRERLSQKRVKIALVTGVLAFLIAGLAVTLPELIFGGSVTGTDRNTTFFGGGGKDDEKERDGDRDGRGGGDRDRDSEGEGGGGQRESPDRPSDSAPEGGDGEGAPSGEPPAEEPPPEDSPPEPEVPQPPAEPPPTP
jgi:hypothetical protein